jgi:hypothetical protein
MNPAHLNRAPQRVQNPLNFRIQNKPKNFKKSPYISQLRETASSSPHKKMKIPVMKKAHTYALPKKKNMFFSPNLQSKKNSKIVNNFFPKKTYFSNRGLTNSFKKRKKSQKKAKKILQKHKAKIEKLEREIQHYLKTGSTHTYNQHRDKQLEVTQFNSILASLRSPIAQIRSLSLLKLCSFLRSLRINNYPGWKINEDSHAKLLPLRSHEEEQVQFLTKIQRRKFGSYLKLTQGLRNQSEEMMVAVDEHGVLIGNFSKNGVVEDAEFAFDLKQKNEELKKMEQKRSKAKPLRGQGGPTARSANQEFELGGEVGDGLDGRRRWYEFFVEFLKGMLEEEGQFGDDGSLLEFYLYNSDYRKFEKMKEFDLLKIFLDNDLKRLPDPKEDLIFVKSSGWRLILVSKDSPKRDPVGQGLFEKIKEEATEEEEAQSIEEKDASQNLKIKGKNLIIVNKRKSIRISEKQYNPRGKSEGFRITTKTRKGLVKEVGMRSEDEEAKEEDGDLRGSGLLKSRKSSIIRRPGRVIQKVVQPTPPTPGGKYANYEQQFSNKNFVHTTKNLGNIGTTGNMTNMGNMGIMGNNQNQLNYQQNLESLNTQFMEPFQYGQGFQDDIKQFRELLRAEGRFEKQNNSQNIRYNRERELNVLQKINDYAKKRQLKRQNNNLMKKEIKAFVRSYKNSKTENSLNNFFPVKNQTAQMMSEKRIQQKSENLADYRRRLSRVSVEPRRKRRGYNIDEKAYSLGSIQGSWVSQSSSEMEDMRQRLLKRMAGRRPEKEKDGYKAVEGVSQSMCLDLLNRGRRAERRGKGFFLKRRKE